MKENKLKKWFQKNKESEVVVVPTLKDEISSNCCWCATFELVWNDLKNNIAKKDIIFSPQEIYAKHLNEEEFTESMLSEKYYYKVCDLKTLELKKQIEKTIEEKFHQKSDILDKFDWREEKLNNELNPEKKKYFLYAMLYRSFEFPYRFDKLGNGKFGQNKKCKYFGIENNSEKLRNQVKVWYYYSVNDFAFSIKTTSNDEIIFCKNPFGDNFQDIYKIIKEKKEKYNGVTYLMSSDKLKIPYINFYVEKEYKELQEKPFITYNGIGFIDKAIQSIKFSLNEKGGTIKSESGIDVTITTSLPLVDDPRYFYVDDTFAFLLKEKEKDIPYFVSKIEDITKFQ